MYQVMQSTVANVPSHGIKPAIAHAALHHLWTE